MSLLTVLIVLIIVGVLLWLVNNYIPLDPKIRKIINIVVVVFVVIWLLNQLGAWHYLQSVNLWRTN